MYKSSDDELMPQVFAVDDDFDDLDLNAPPTSGEEYLKRVMLEAKQYPKVVVAELDSNITSNNHRPLSSSILGSSKQPAPKGFAPSVKWQKDQESEFSIVRQNLVTQKARLKKEKQKCKKLPLKDDVNGWCHLCFGDRPSVCRPWTDDSETTDSEQPEQQQQPQPNQGTLPLLSIIARMDQPTIVKVLEYHVNWFEATGFGTKQGCWFYALLACLEKPLDPEVCSLLRTLARHCATTRATLESVEDEQLAPLNLIICIIARYFGQTDLADNPT